MNGNARVIRADSRSLPLADDSVDLVITSPPYFALRSYTDGGVHYERQIGAEATPEEFVSSLLEVTAECMRVLKPSGSLWVNLGDKYAQTEERSRNGNGNRVNSDNFASGHGIDDLADQLWHDLGGTYEALVCLEVAERTEPSDTDTDRKAKLRVVAIEVPRSGDGHRRLADQRRALYAERTGKDTLMDT